MKEYNIKAIVDKDELKFAFECDKEKNTKCKKTYCGRDACSHTSDSRYMKAKDMLHNKKVIYKQELQETIRQKDDLIKEYQELLTNIVINKEDIFNIKTPNQIRKLLGNNELKKEKLDKKLELTINDEECLIQYNSNRETNTIQLNAYLTKLTNEKDKIMIAKDNEFKIINKTRAKEYEKRWELF